MMPWLVTVLLVGSVCSAVLGLAWLLGVRRGWLLWLLATGAGAVLGAAMAALATALVGAGGSTEALLRGVTVGGAIGAGIGLLAWLGSTRSGGMP